MIAIENVRLFQELKESLEQQTATSEILGVIASSPTDIQPVLDTVIANAVNLAGAKLGHVRQFDGDLLRVVAVLWRDARTRRDTSCQSFIAHARQPHRSSFYRAQTDPYS